MTSIFSTNFSNLGYLIHRNHQMKNFNSHQRRISWKTYSKQSARTFVQLFCTLLSNPHKVLILSSNLSDPAAFHECLYVLNRVILSEYFGLLLFITELSFDGVVF